MLESKYAFTAFSDDVTILIKCKDLPDILKLLQRFEKRSGLKISLQKCRLLSPFPNPYGYNTFGIPTVTKCEILGMEIPFSLNFIQKKVTHAISTLTTWKKFRFSLFTSIIIINSYFLPKLQHLYPYIYFGEKIHKQIEDAILENSSPTIIATL